MGIPFLLAMNGSELDVPTLKRAIMYCLQRCISPEDAQGWTDADEGDKMDTGDDSGVEENGVESVDSSEKSPPEMFAMGLTNTYGNTILHHLKEDSDFKVKNKSFPFTCSILNIVNVLQCYIPFSDCARSLHYKFVWISNWTFAKR